MQLQPGTYLQGDKYRIIRTLGMGGFGITYLAEHELAGRNVCIKEFFPKEFYNRDDNSRSISLGSKGSAEIMDAYKAKFIKEAKTIARLNHPNIIHIFDVFAENNTAYYVMEYIEGESLSAVVRERGALAEADAIKYIRAVAEALGYIHDRKIMHLDIKPANVMLRKEDGRAILIDFGLSKQYDAEGNQTSSTPVGISAGYAPMEQYQQGGVKEFSPETDIYSLGATLYYLVTGEVPPQAAAVVDRGLPELPAHLSSGVRNAIERSMEIQRRRRPHSIKEFLALLEDNTPKVAVAPTPASVGVETKIKVQTAVVEEKTVISTPQPKVESKTKPQPTPKPKKSKRGLWIMLTAFVMAAVASFVLLGGGSSEKVTPKQPLPPNNEIWYTSSDGNIVEPFKCGKDIFGAEIVSNTYENGKGIIKFDGDVTTIGDWAFYNCDSLKSVTIPNSVTAIEEDAFSDCSSLTTITIPDSVTTIENGAFRNCSSLTSITIPNSVTTIGRDTFFRCYSLTSVTLPNSVTTIGEFAFYNCDSLKSVTIPNSVTTIGKNAFYDCSSLTSVTIPNSVTTIGKNAFYDCSSLTSVTIPNSVTTIGGSAFADCSSLTSITIPDSVTTIGYGAFAGCSSLTSITIPDSVTTIGGSAFSNCSSLTSLTIPNSVTTIEEGAFYDCSSLTSITLPNSVTTIGYGAFRNCSSLTSITIPNSVTTIGYGAFYGCNNLSEETKKKIRLINSYAISMY